MSTEQIQQFNNFLKTNLNSAQLEAVTHGNGSLLIVAGAGSGKTRVITTRITHLMLNQNALSSSIVALTFTNKAAQEMKERIEQFLDRSHDLPFVGTFHSFCLRLLKQHNELLPDPFFSILDEDDQHKIIQNIITRAGINKKVTAKQLAYQISQIKNQTINPENDIHSLSPLVRDVFINYEKEKRASKCLDFDDLLLQTVSLFKKNPEFKANFQERVDHILVDEYQDTNVVQHELLKQMALTGEVASKRNPTLAIDSLCAVGDEDQSIYSWRGATVTNIMNFATDFQNTRVIKIEQNYRSVQSILDLANQVITHNANRNPKTLWSEKKGADRIRQIAFLSEYQEAEGIALYLKIAAKRQRLQTIAILYRTHFQSRALEEALLKHMIPYKIIGGIQFYERKEIKDILAYLKLVVNPFDRASFFRVINCPLRGLGLKFEEQFQETWNANLFATFKDIAQIMIESKEVAGAKKDALVLFVKLFDTMSHTDKPGKTVQAMINAVGYFIYLKENYEPEEAMAKIDNVKELLQAIDHLESQKITTISDFLDEVALMQAQIQAESNEKDPVLLMSLHAAKGLEFDTIILTGLEEGLLPSTRSLAMEESIEEERRLFYVGITRAQERLLLTYSRYRYHYGTMNDQRPSRFVREIAAGTVPIFDGSYWNSAQTTQFFNAWSSSNPSSSSSFALRAPSKRTGVGNDDNPNRLSAQALARAGSKHPSTPGEIESQSAPVRRSFSEDGSRRFKKNQPVSHAKFGLGIVEDIELRGNGVTYLQIKFKSGRKKLDASWIKQI